MSLTETRKGRSMAAPAPARRAPAERRGRRPPMAVPHDGRKSRRPLKFWLGRGLWVALAGSAGLAIWLALELPRNFAAAPDFRLKALEVRGLRLLRGADILAASGLREGENIFGIDLPQVAQRLQSLPWVKRVYLERRPPDRLRVGVVERRRLAWISLGRLYGIDEEGVLLPPEKETAELRADLDLPIVSGFEAGALPRQPGDRVAIPELIRLLEWWRQARQHDAEFCQNISEIQPLPGRCVRLLLVGDGLEVRLPVDRVDERLAVLKTLLGRIYREGPAPAYLDLRFAGQAVVGGRDSLASS